MTAEPGVVAGNGRARLTVARHRHSLSGEDTSSCCGESDSDDRSPGGAEREGYLKTAIELHGDTWYLDGVQVGAAARVHLATLYAAGGRLAEARSLAREVADNFRGAVDHSGRPLVETLRSMKLL